MLKSFLAISLLSGTFIAAQEKAPPAKPSPPPAPVFDVTLSPDSDLSVGMPDNLPVFSSQCDANGNPYASIITMVAPFRQIIGFTKKGVVTFSTSQMTDIPEPRIGRMFMGETSLYVLVEGTENAKQEEFVSEDETGKETKRSRTVGERRDYIARFDLDGTYRGAVKLDRGFRTMQLAVFGSGDFAIAGTNENEKAEVQILNSTGQLLAYLNLPKDITEKPERAEKSFEKLGIGDASIGVIAMFAAFYPYHGNVLLVRSGDLSPIYEIREGGEARSVRIKSPDGFAIDHFIPSDKNWMVDFRKGLAEETDTIYEVSPETGEILGHYRIRGEEGAKDQISCVLQGGDFVGIRHQKAKLTIVRGTAEHTQGREASASQ
jgi:hypothetical protein